MDQSGEDGDGYSAVKLSIASFAFKKLTCAAPSSAKPASVSTEWQRVIGGVQVKFPFPPYPAQIAFMDKVLKCLTTEQHGLLESPTGSGKSLSLLCSALAWQSEKQNMLAKEKQEQLEEMVNKKGKCSVGSRGQCIDVSSWPSAAGLCCSQRSSSISAADSSTSSVSSFGFEDDMDIQWPSEEWLSFLQTPVKPPIPSPQPIPSPKVQMEPEIEIVEVKRAIAVRDIYRSGQKSKPPLIAERGGRVGKSKAIKFSESEGDEEEDKNNTRIRGIGAKIAPNLAGSSGMPESAHKTGDFVVNGEEWSLDEASLAEWDTPEEQQVKDKLPNNRSAEPIVPKIFFGSRTHKQITQLVGELRKTSYGKSINMTVLGSRDQYCIHPALTGQKNKDEKCTQLRDKKQKHRNLEGGQFEAWGDGCEYHKKSMAFSHLDLASYGVPTAFDVEDLSDAGKENLFCPYYSSSKLAADSQLIFCPYQYLIDARIRKAREIKLDGQIIIFDEGHNMEDASRDAASLTLINTQLHAAADDFKRVSHRLDMKQNMVYLSQICTTMADWMEKTGACILGNTDGGTKDYSGKEINTVLRELGFGPDDGFATVCEVIITEHNKPNNERQDDSSPRISGASLQLLRGMLVILDYLFRDQEKHATDYRICLQKYVSFDNSYHTSSDGWRNKRRKAGEAEWTYKLNLWCMNPGVAFGDFAAAKCVLLTSGTLSPLQSFQSELGLNFGVKFEANHVINMEQVWAGGIGQGPNKSSLLAVYKTTQTLIYQDDLGASVLRVCSIVPKGVLCFFSSYTLMNTLIARWKESGVWRAILEKKRIFEEPRGSTGDKLVFERIMNEYYKAVLGVDGPDGALMLAVFRGKISEGLDFSDDKARAVITVGIPYPHFMDVQVKMKREFNDANVCNGFLPSSTWYDVQAFRALNQALGRCLRHKNDWGALILLDSRFATGDDRYTKSLSKWLRSPNIKPYDNFEGAMRNLQQFVERRVALTGAVGRNGGVKTEKGLPAEDVNFLTDDEDRSN